MSKSSEKIEKVNFFIVGAPKCGTTTLHEVLSNHPSFDFGRKKEPHCFSSDLKLKGHISLEEYEQGYDFKDCKKVVFGDASVMHLYSKEAAKNINIYNNKSKILVMIREPVGFIQSYHHEQIYNGNETELDLAVAWSLSADRKMQRRVPPGCPDGKILNYKEIAAFDVQIKRYLDVFGPEKVLICTLDELKNNPRRLYLKILKFVGVDDDEQNFFPQLASAKAYDSSVSKFVVDLLTSKMVQKFFQGLKKAVGFNGKFGFVSAFRKRHTISGEKRSVEASLKEKIFINYKDSYESALVLANKLDLECSEFANKNK